MCAKLSHLSYLVFTFCALCNDRRETYNITFNGCISFSPQHPLSFFTHLTDIYLQCPRPTLLTQTLLCVTTCAILSTVLSQPWGLLPIWSLTCWRKKMSNVLPLQTSSCAILLAVFLVGLQLKGPLNILHPLSQHYPQVCHFQLRTLTRSKNLWNRRIRLHPPALFFQGMCILCSLLHDFWPSLF